MYHTTVIRFGLAPEVIECHSIACNTNVFTGVGMAELSGFIWRKKSNTTS